jgi:hypothetical protein
MFRTGMPMKRCGSSFCEACWSLRNGPLRGGLELVVPDIRLPALSARIGRARATGGLTSWIWATCTLPAARRCTPDSRG